jgi:hypothetical protein
MVTGIIEYYTRAASPLVGRLPGMCLEFAADAPPMPDTEGFRSLGLNDITP